MLLCIDIGTHLGWARGPMDASAPVDSVTLGTIKLRDTTNLGAWLMSGDGQLRDLLQSGVTALVVEQPNTQRQHHTGIVKNCAQLGWICWHASQLGFPAPTLYGPGKGKLRMTGDGNAKKPAMISAAMDLGYDPQDEHQADAIALRHVHLFGVPDTKAQRQAKEVAARRAARAAAKAPNLL